MLIRRNVMGQGLAASAPESWGSPDVADCGKARECRASRLAYAPARQQPS